MPKRFVKNIVDLFQTDKLFRVPPRESRISWNDRHMLEAMLTASRSPDPNTQVGACIVNPRNRVLGTGYNSYPNNVGATDFSWSRDNPDPLLTKYPYVVHAEKNAIYNAVGSVEDCTVFVTMFPCCECAKDLIQAGIEKVVYLSDPYPNTWQIQASKALLQKAKIQFEQHEWQNKTNVKSLLQKLIDTLAP